MSAQWAVAQGMYYEDHPDLRNNPKYSGSKWSTHVISVFIESALDLCGARNKELHGTTPEEQRNIQRQRAIAVVQKKYLEGTIHMRRRFPMLYRESS